MTDADYVEYLALRAFGSFQASEWMDTPHKEFGWQTPKAMVALGHAAEVATYLNWIVAAGD